MRRNCGLAHVAFENDEPEAKPHDEEAEMTAMRTVVSELTTSIAFTALICALMMMALG